jgi:hypothetical protein
MQDLVEGRTPLMRTVLMVRTAIQQTYDVYEPVNLGVKMAAALDVSGTGGNEGSQ